MLKSVYKSLTTKYTVRFPDGRMFETDEQYSPNEVREAVHRVNAGMERLDAVIPTWHDKISLDSLEMSDGQHCIVGQTFDGYSETAVAFVKGITSSPDEYAELCATRYSDNSVLRRAADREYDILRPLVLRAEMDLGFLSDSEAGIDFDLLDVVWVSALRKRAKASGKRVFLTVPS